MGKAKKTSTFQALMDGVDLMSKGELVIQCEKHSLDGGKTVASMKYALKKYYEEHGDDDDDDADVSPPAKKKAKTDIGGSSSSLDGSKTKICPKGAACPDLYSLSHRLAYHHDGFRSNPIKCRDGMGCPKLKDKDHLQKYAHDDDLSKVCPHGADCPKLYQMKHRLEYEHPGYRAKPFPCRDGMKCPLLKDKGHLYKYAHVEDEEAGSDATLGTSTTISSKASKPSPAVHDDGDGDEVPPPAAAGGKSLASAKAPIKKAISPKKKAPASSEEPAAEPTITTTSSEDDWKKPVAERIKGKTLEDFPLDSAPETELIELEDDGNDEWERLEKEFSYHTLGRNEDYVAKRIKKGLKPITFVLKGIEKVVNPVLEARYELKKKEILEKRKDVVPLKQLKERFTFHGTHPKNLKSLLRYSLLRFKHPLNPCKTQSDDGYFGTNLKGVYVSKYADYCLKYSNRGCPLDEGETCKLIMFRTMPGQSKKIDAVTPKLQPTPGYDSHTSPSDIEYYLFDEAQLLPAYVLKIRAFVDTRTAADDE